MATISEALQAILDDIKVVADAKNQIFNKNDRPLGRGENLKDHAEAAKFLREALSLAEQVVGAAGGDLTGSFPNPDIAANAVDNTKAADMTPNTIKGRDAVGTGDPKDLTATQVKTILGLIATILGPGSSTLNAASRFSDTTGTLLKDSPIIIGDAGEVDGVEHIDFNLITSIPDIEGGIFYNTNNKALELATDIPGSRQSLGQEFWVRIINKTGLGINDGKVVYINGADGASGRPTIALAKADNEVTANVLGFATHDIPNNTEGFVTITGFINDLDTSSFASGDQLFLSADTAGEFTTIKPTIVVPVGIVTQINSVTGQIFASVNRINTDSPIFAQLSSIVDQVPSTTNPTVITYEIQGDIAGLTHSVSTDPGEITVVIDGTYYVIVQPQVGKDSGASKLDMTIFFQLDEGGGFADGPRSAAKLTIKDADRQDVLVIAFTKRFSAGDKLRVMQRAESTTGGLGLKATAAETGPPTIPITPSVIFSMLRIGGF